MNRITDIALDPESPDGMLAVRITGSHTDLTGDTRQVEFILGVDYDPDTDAPLSNAWPEDFGWEYVTSGDEPTPVWDERENPAEWSAAWDAAETFIQAELAKREARWQDEMNAAAMLDPDEIAAWVQADEAEASEWV